MSHITRTRTTGVTRQYVRQAVFDALEPLGEFNRHVVIYHLQKEYGIRFAEGPQSPTIPDIESALKSVFGLAARFFIKRFEEQLQKYPLTELTN